MKFIAISFTLKDQSPEDIIKVIALLAERNHSAVGNTVLVHGFMPRADVVQKGLSLDIVDALQKYFPYQLNCYVAGSPDRAAMVNIMSETGGTVYVIGEIKAGVADEVAHYENAGVNMSNLPLNWSGNVPQRDLTYGEKAVGLTFNHGVGPINKQINDAKVTCAKAIDMMNILRGKSESGEYKALATIAIRSLQLSQMNMVKAITWQD